MVNLCRLSIIGWTLAAFFGFGGCKKVYRDTTGIDCESDVEPEAGTCQDLLDEGTCEQDWMMEGFFCITTCDFCDKKKQESESVSNGVGRSFGFAPFSFTSSVFIDLRSRTLRGCKCPTWIYEGNVYTGCGNPNKSPLGGWCPVTQEDCPFDPIYTSNVPIKVVYDFGDGSKEEVAIGGDTEYTIDSCTCLPDSMCKRTRGGCRCTSSCSNPDYDSKGPWCFVDKNSCPQNFIPEKNTEDTDYCRPGCCPV